MTMPRIVAAETLDGLAEGDPAAVRSRRDLRRVHRAMGTHGIVLRALRGVSPTGSAPVRVLELGAGDGTLMLGVARSLKKEWGSVELTLLDRQDLVEPGTVEAYSAAGWKATREVSDVLDWAAATPAAARWDLIVANLFLHHFAGAQLAALLAAIEARSRRVFACEPRRAWLALAGSHLVGAIGANAVTREDAVLSVHAGFRETELSALWPGRDAWALHEYGAGLFSHCFCAQRRDVAAPVGADARRRFARVGPH